MSAAFTWFILYLDVGVHTAEAIAGAQVPVSTHGAFLWAPENGLDGDLVVAFVAVLLHALAPERAHGKLVRANET